MKRHSPDTSSSSTDSSISSLDELIICSGNLINFAGIRGSLRDVPSLDETERVLVQELNELSVQERERLQEEVHGIANPMVEESPDLIERRLLQMDDELTRIRKRSAYDRALFLCPSYVKDRSFRLLFLRADDLHPRRAAQRMVDFFDFKLELFGMDLLGKRIRLEDVPSMNVGYSQMLPQKDRSGRAILCALPKFQNYLSFTEKVWDETVDDLHRQEHMESMEKQKWALLCICICRRPFRVIYQAMDISHVFFFS